MEGKELYKASVKTIYDTMHKEYTDALLASVDI
jgi:hypothetical protein